MHIPADKHRKLDVKAIEVTLVGFEPGSKGYQLWDKQTHSMKLSRDVTFDESSFPSQKDVETSPAPTQMLLVVTAPNPAVQPLLHITRAPSPTPSVSSEASVENLIYQPRPHTPPATSVVVPFPPPNTPHTPKKECEVPHSPPSHPSAT
jgi:hypothetical protein